MSGGADVLATTNAAQASRAHQPRHASPADRQPLAQPQLGMNPARAVDTSSGRVDIDDRIEQVGVGDIAGRGRAAPPLVEPRSGHLQHPAGHRDVEPVSGELLDQPEPYFGRTFSRAK